ncbi:hypothetical protein Ancab_026021 [Ancistrocladus abbreviatus]
MVDRKGKRVSVFISSSCSSSSSDDHDDVDDDEDYENEDNEGGSTSSNSSDDEYELTEGDDDGDEEEEEEGEGDDAEDDQAGDSSSDLDEDALSNCNLVIEKLQGCSNLQELNLKECKAYLRRNRLRVSGTKDICLQRIQHHWRIKDGNGEALYPRSSFVINCTGDVCKGDIVLFIQKVYGRFDKVTQTGRLLGRRTIAGHVVKESYGAVKQQHTFTVEVLWSKGIKKLPPLFPLLVKGRNLYRLKTFRQLWGNEAERSKVLAEKHKRGTVARQKKAMRNRRRSADRGVKRQKVSHCTGLSRMNHLERSWHVDVHEKATSSRHLVSYNHQKTRITKHPTAKQITRGKSVKPAKRHWTCLQDRVLTLQSSHDTTHKVNLQQMEPDRRFAPFAFPNEGIHSSASARFPREMLYHGSVVMPRAQCYGVNQSTFNHHPCDRESSKLNIYPQMVSRQPLQLIPSGINVDWQRGFSTCSTGGCQDLASSRCIISACWKCCRKVGVRCHFHQ